MLIFLRLTNLKFQEQEIDGEGMINAVSLTTTLLDIPPFRIQGNQYQSPSVRYLNNGKILAEWAGITRLTETLINPDKLSYTLRFPFSQPKTYTIYPASKGFTRQSIIDEIRRSYRQLFRHSKETAHQWESTTSNNKVTQYQVMYPFSGLYVDRIYFDQENNSLDIRADGMPSPQNNLELPF